MDHRCNQMTKGAKTMPKTLTLSITFVIAVVMATLPASIDCFAQDRPTKCVAGNKYTVTPTPGMDFPQFIPERGYLWSYRISASSVNMSKINKAYIST